MSLYTADHFKLDEDEMLTDPTLTAKGLELWNPAQKKVLFALKINNFFRAILQLHRILLQWLHLAFSLI